MINQVVLIGRLTKDIEIRYTKDEKAVGNFTLAVQRRFKDSNGNPVVDFIDCVIFGKQAEAMQKYSHKGDMLGVEGSIQKRDYENKDGKKVYLTEIMVEKITFISQGKKKEEPEENPYKDMSIKVESESNIKYEEEQLPF